MGLFVSVTAFQTSDRSIVESGIVQYCSNYDVGVRLMSDINIGAEREIAKLYKPKKGWCVVIWPNHFGFHEIEMAKSLSKDLNILTSTVHVHDSDFWCHRFFDCGEQLDDFCSDPHYWEESKELSIELLNEFQENAANVAYSVGIEKSDIEGYYLPVVEDKAYGKVHQDDCWELDDDWVFVDFWRRIGIVYPQNPEEFESVIEIADTYDEKLP